MFSLVLCAAACLAGERCHISAGPMFGTTLGGTTESSERVWGGQILVHFNDRFALELAVMNLTDHPEEERYCVSVTSALEITPVNLSIRYSRPVIGSRLSLYVLAGIGYYFNEDNDFEIQGMVPGGIVSQTGPLTVERPDSLGLHAAGGLEYTILGSLTALLEYRMAEIFNDADISGLSANSPEGQVAINAFERDFWDNNELGMLRIGLNWCF